MLTLLVIGACFERAASGTSLPAVACLLEASQISTACSGSISFSESGASAFASIDLGPALLLTANATSIPSLGAGGGAMVSGAYEVVGPSGPAVSILVQASASGTFSGLDPSAIATADLGVQNYCWDYPVNSQCLGSDVRLPVDADVSVPVDQEEFFQLAASADAPVGGASSSEISLDPLLSIDPSDRNAGEYSLIFSPGFSETNTTPEPGGLECAALGGGLIALAKIMGTKMGSRTGSSCRRDSCFVPCGGKEDEQKLERHAHGWAV